MKNILTEYSPWFILLCMLIGLAYTWLLYQKEAPWSKRINQLLAVGRFVLVTILCILLIGPFIKDVINYFEKPTIVLAIDNSESVKLVNDTTRLQQIISELNGLSEALQQEGYQVDLRTLSLEQPQSLSEVRFNEGQTDLSSLIKGIQSDYENQNLGEVILLSDGIYNQGISPDYGNYSMKISAIGIGDTMPQLDVNLKGIFSNKIAYLGNQFPIVAEVGNVGFTGRQASVALIHQGKEIDRKTINFNQNNGLQTVDFLATASQEGMQRYVVQVSALEGEFTVQNNVRNVFVDVLDSKEKILLVAAAPHPDIKAIRSIVEQNENYEFVVYIPSLANVPGATPVNLNDQYDLVIFHQVPNTKAIGNSLLADFERRRIPAWFILGTQSDLTDFNRNNRIVAVKSSGRQTDRVTPNFNNSFNKFTFEPDKKAILAKSPPIIVPFGTVEVTAAAEVILYQKVGSVVTDKPMLVVGEHDGVKNAVLIGEGIWQWKLQEYATTNKNEAFEEMISKLIQFLSAKEDKRRFRVYPSADEYLAGETVYLETEVYNDIYEKIYGQEIDLKVTNEAGESTSYQYVNNPNFRYALRGLDAGIYRYSANTMLDGKAEVVKGEFTIKKMELEAITTTANFNLLRNLTNQTNGSFYYPDELEEIKSRLLSEKYPSRIHSQEEFQEAMNFKWILVLLMIFATAEWVVRKVRGGY